MFASGSLPAGERTATLSPVADPHNRSRLRERNLALNITHVLADYHLASPEHIDALIKLMQDASIQVGTLKTAAAPIDIPNPSAVKLVTDCKGRALYFSRATIPFDRDTVIRLAVITLLPVAPLLLTMLSLEELLKRLLQVVL